jgi:UPF0755 protein
MKRSRIILLFVFLLLSLGAVLSWKAYHLVFSANVKVFDGPEYLYIDEGHTLDSLYQNLKPYLQNARGFDVLAERKGLKEPLKLGRYELRNGMSNNELINILRIGNQTPLNLTINLVQTLPQLAGVIANTLQFDSLKYLRYLESEEVLVHLKMTKEELPGLFLANTYEFYWTTTPEEFVERMKREYDHFWSERSGLLARSGFTANEIITLASIVESETAMPDEKPVVAGLYINRLKQGIKLESDPTLIYILKLKEPTAVIRRVYDSHKELESAYNTYQHLGLPPGPIRITDPSTIDAVLKPVQHDYIFMCANPDTPGYHSFARTNAQHNRNAAKYHSWANEQGF